MEPITFSPIYMERVWGGREFERIYGRSLPQPATPFGESWELVDREEAQSVVATGAHVGKTLHELWSEHRREIFGIDGPAPARFPILLKILDARDDLSIQVHPPAALAEKLGGEPKTEMWVIADRTPGAKLYVGLKRGVDRAAFERAIHDGTLADCVHAIEPSPGESIFIPSGRLHAIGAGFLIHEIQQNSDTTYRVFDWNRPGLDGRPRELHIEPSLASIDFDDVEPGMDSPQGPVLADCPYFKTERLHLMPGDALTTGTPHRFAIISLLTGTLATTAGIPFPAGQTLLLPPGGKLQSPTPSTVLRITIAD